jgi:hypothetical protein
VANGEGLRSIKGVVTSAQDGTPLEGAYVLIKIKSGIIMDGYFGDTVQLTTESDGSYDTSTYWFPFRPPGIPLPEGEYDVSATKGGTPATKDGFVPGRAEVSLSNAVPIITLPFVLEPARPFTINGMVIDTNGNPIRGATVELRWVGYLHIMTNSSGFYSFAYNPHTYDGAYGINATASGFERREVAIPKIPNGATIPQPPFILAKLPIVTGTVTDTAGGAIKGAVVTVRNTISEDAHTNDSGFYSMIIDPPGDYNVVTAATGFETTAPVSITLSKDTTITLPFVLKRIGGTITGNVTNDAGIPMVHANVTAAGSLEPVWALTSSSGNYTLPNVPSGPTTITASL